MNVHEVRSEADARTAKVLMEDQTVKTVVEHLEKQGERLGTRRGLLAQALRLTPAVAPKTHKVLDHCRERLSVEHQVEMYVYSSPSFNAACTPPEGDRVFVLFSSALLEAFEDEELTFVMGHELGHHVYAHHDVPLGVLLSGKMKIRPALAMRLFNWQRQAEISADRAGLLCCGTFEAAARGFFKLSSGLTRAPGPAEIRAFVDQSEELFREDDAMTAAQQKHQMDWTSSHPFSPIRLKAAESFTKSVAFNPDGTRLADVEVEVEELMGLMEASYLEEDSQEAETMRRALFTAGILLADLDGGITEEEKDALIELLGPRSISPTLEPDRLKPLLDERIENLKEIVRTARRVQWMRDLTSIAMVDKNLSDVERGFLVSVAHKAGLSERVIDQALARHRDLD